MVLSWEGESNYTVLGLEYNAIQNMTFDEI